MQHEIGLFDSNVTMPSSLGTTLYEVRSYDSVPADLIMQSNEEMDKILGLMHRKKIRTIVDVVNELIDIQHIIADKTKFLGKRKRGYSSEGKYYIELLGKQINRLVRKAGKSVYKPSSDSDYKRLHGLAVDVDDSLRLKKRRGKYTNVPESRKTDEGLAATLFYVSLFEGKKANILTCDFDILRFPDTLFYLFTYALEQDYREMALRKLSKNPVTISFIPTEEEISYPPTNGSYKVLESFERINPEMKEEARKIVRMAYGIKK